MIDEKQAYFEYIQAYCKNPELDKIKDITNAPAPIQLAVEKLAKYGQRDSTIQSEGIADLKQSYFELKGLPNDVKSLIRPYVIKKARFL